MQRKFRFAIILFIIVSVSISACSAGNTNDTNLILPTFEIPTSNTSAVEGICDNVLYPVKQGATWMYTSTGGPSGSFNYTNSITEVRADGFTLTSQFPNVTRQQEWICQADGIQAVQFGGGSAVGISIQEMTTDLITSNVIGLNLPKKITAGMQWKYSLELAGSIAMLGDPQSPAHGTYSVVMQELGNEMVTVPAGTFEAVKIQSTSTVDILSSFGGIEVPIKFSGTTITWYSPAIGYVKSVENGDFSGEAFSATTELQSYNIP